MKPVASCDVLVVGGGPAGSSCARTLASAGIDVLVVDRASFPRDKVCAGWITPPVLDLTKVVPEEYGAGRTLQPISRFRTGLIGRAAGVTTEYDHIVSFGIRRCEFDEFLLRRSGARLLLGTAVQTLARERDRWVVNGAIEARTIVGAGGHFCPVGRWVNRDAPSVPVVVAQEAEYRADGPAATCRAEPGVPEFYFSPDLKGYGWCFRKQQYVNIGMGRVGERSLPAATSAFLAFLESRGRLAKGPPPRWKGHAYRLSRPRGGTLGGQGVLLAGDAAGVAFPESGEGIRPAVESGLLAADVILEAGGHVTEQSVASYEQRLRERFQFDASSWFGSPLSERLATTLAPLLLAVPAFVRRVVLDRWFLHRADSALALRNC